MTLTELILSVLLLISIAYNIWITARIHQVYKGIARFNRLYK
jgi:hypothetical protein